MGVHVFILKQHDSFSRRQGGVRTKTIRIPGIIRRYDGSKFWVDYYGRPHHFTPPGRDFGVYCEPFTIEELEPRTPNENDPLEF